MRYSHDDASGRLAGEDAGGEGRRCARRWGAEIVKQVPKLMFAVCFYHMTVAHHLMFC